MKRLLFIGDSPACPSGFGRAARETLEVLRQEYEITVLGINALGDPYDRVAMPYDIYVAAIGGDAFGIGRLIWMCDLVKPDVIWIQNDGWNIQCYLQQLAKYPEYAKIPVVASIAVDGKNFQSRWLDGVALAIFWTKFGLNEARVGGYVGPATVIPLGVDLETYHPIDKYEARSRLLPRTLDDAFIVGNVNRNQPRKRWDLTVKYFAEWVKAKKITDAYLYLHTAPTGDTGADVKQLAKYYGVLDKLAMMEPAMFYGIPEHSMRDTYNCFDVDITTTQGEGMGLTSLEAMACGVPVIAPDWAALGDWGKGAMWLVKCSNTIVGSPYVNVIGGIPDQDAFVVALDALYQNPSARKQNGLAGLERAQESRFRWNNIGQAFLAAVNGVLEPVSV